MSKNPDAFLDELVGDLRPVKPLHQRVGMAWACLAVGTGAILLSSVLAMRADLRAGHPDPMFLTSAGLFFVLALATSWAAVDMARPWVGTSRDGWGWTALMAAVLPAAAMGLVVLNWSLGKPVSVDSDGLECLWVGSVIGLITATVLVLWLRRGAPSCPRRAGMLTGVAAGSAGIFAVSLCCPYNDLLHIGLWHGSAVVLGGAVGRLIVPRLIRW